MIPLPGVTFALKHSFPQFSTVSPEAVILRICFEMLHFRSNLMKSKGYRIPPNITQKNLR